ncbi:tRNA (guanine(37)-N(1))-methyltransferase [Saccharolobus shibatae B12]|uniref:tRNA (Guanine(37)-N(1))-methyltransferase n=1 Tax=Saccharolobus shibatae (strain ATCC 51178 / DSM 5389 / JCM 8931 / NBRC 15437 / B12) TaxID=523848 RepID=A0A8F5BMZ5_SACSH|nr:methyltransferase [Saccharolobus shibatae]QXJ28164.1 tRNA (guanine(37)-N(1))-methyltransferase [Saccharolobus shibatae B12]
MKTERLNAYFPGVRSYYIIGEIAIVTPKRVNVDYNLVAQKIMQAHPKIKAVYLKKKVKGELRTNELEFLSGERISSTIYKENGVLFYVDIVTVYVNPSLSGDRLKNVELVEEGSTILDAFTGYGAIALNIAHKKKAYVVAGDVNIDGLYLLKKSLSLNKIKGMIDIVQYDAHYLPFRDKVFKLSFGDNPTLIIDFKEELCRVSENVVFYILCESKDKANSSLGKTEWVKINDYSKNLFIFKGVVRC